MAENRAVWGIDIGQAGLKAIRLKYAEQAGQVLAVAFDYIPHPKILSQPDAIPKDLIRQALETFLSRNSVAGDLISISLPGHSALARFIQLPPVESSKIHDVVTYEARQQIPFALDDVIWDYQTLGGGIEESGFMLGAEVGLFAMKKEQVHEALRPFNEAKVEVETVQIAPLALYNFHVYDQMGARLSEDFSPPEEHTIVLDMGTDNTTLMVTNGEKIWIRNVPLGGNHFTRALTKEMKLTFAKAEHLKCNATKSPDPRAVFQALRPVFNDYVNEIQRSIGYFSSVNRDAKIARVVGVGNGFKLAGLQKFLQQNLQYEVERVETFNAAVGDTVLTAPLFQENIMAFVVPYGLALQTLKITKIHTTLLPPEIAVARKIRRKKPWAVTTASVLLAGLATSAAGYSSTAENVSTDRFGTQESAVGTVKTQFSNGKSAYETAKGDHAKLVTEGEFLVSYIHRRELWPELFRAVDECLPRPVGNQLYETDITRIPRISIRSITAKRYADMGSWFSGLKDEHKNFLTDAEKTTGPSGEGYIVTLIGEHFYSPPDDQLGGGIIFVDRTLLQNLRKPFLQQENNPNGPVPVAVLGISHPAVTSDPLIEKVYWYPGGPPRKGASSSITSPFGPTATGTGPGSPVPGAGTPNGGTAVNGGAVQITRKKFTLQFAWKPTLPADRVLPVTEQPVDPSGELSGAGVQPPDAGAGLNPAAAPANPATPGGVAPVSGGPVLGQ